MKYELPRLPYAYDALEPHIDAQTMEIHHAKHHQGYVDKLNEALGKHPESAFSLEEMLSSLETAPEDIRVAVRNNGGGYFNHSLFWISMGPEKEIRKEPSGKLREALNNDFGEVEKFKDSFSQAAMSRFGSGWAWLCSDESGKLSVISTANQDTPLEKHLTPLLGLDIWEHAYYLKYQNKRLDYVVAWWNVVNWEEVEKRYKG